MRSVRMMQILGAGGWRECDKWLQCVVAKAVSIQKLIELFSVWTKFD